MGGPSPVVIQRVTDETGREVTAGDVYDVFKQEYLDRRTPWKLIRHRIVGDPAAGEGRDFNIEAEVEVNGERRTIRGEGNGAISAFVAAIGLPVRVLDYHEHAIGAGADSRAACYVEVRVGEATSGFGVGVDRDIVTASFHALLCAVNRHLEADPALAQNAVENAEAPAAA